MQPASRVGDLAWRLKSSPINGGAIRFPFMLAQVWDACGEELLAGHELSRCLQAPCGLTQHASAVWSDSAHPDMQKMCVAMVACASDVVHGKALTWGHRSLQGGLHGQGRLAGSIHLHNARQTMLA